MVSRAIQSSPAGLQLDWNVSEALACLLNVRFVLAATLRSGKSITFI